VPERLQADLVVHDAEELCTMQGPAGGGEAAAGILRNGALAARAGTIVWVGPSAEIARHVELRPGAVEIDATELNLDQVIAVIAGLALAKKPSTGRAST